MSDTTDKPVRQKYKVTIVETLVEKRTYNIVAADPLEAAKRAQTLWLDHAVEPKDGPSVGVIDREYVVEGEDSVFALDIADIECDEDAEEEE